MARPKKKVSEAENSEPNETQPSTKTVEAKHVVTYFEPVTVPVTEADSAETDDGDSPDLEEEESEQAEKPAKPSFRAKLRERLTRNGISDAEQLRLRVDRLPHYDENGLAGVNAEKDFVRIVPCTEGFITSDDYLEFIRSKDGPGAYWFTLRYKNNIIASWHKRIAGNAQPAPSGEAVSLEGNVAAVAQNPSDLMDAMFKQFEKFQKFQAAMMPPWMKQVNPEWMQPGNQAAQPLTTESALLTLLNSDDDLVTQSVGKLKKLFRGDGGIADEKGPWDAIVALITSPTLPQTVQMLMSQFRQPTNGQQQQSNPAPQPQAVPSDQAAYERLMQLLLQSMRINGDVEPVLIAIDGFIALFPEHGPMINSFFNASTELLLPGLAQASPAAAEIVALPHAKEWIEKLKAAYFPEDNEDKE